MANFWSPLNIEWIRKEIEKLDQDASPSLFFSFFSLKFICEIISWNQDAINCSSTTHIIQLKNLTVKYIQVLFLPIHKWWISYWYFKKETKWKESKLMSDTVSTFRIWELPQSKNIISKCQPSSIIFQIRLSFKLGICRQLHFLES